MCSEHPYAETSQGLWCNVCGNHVATDYDLEDEGFEPPTDCPQCGWPDDFDPDRI